MLQNSISQATYDYHIEMRWSSASSYKKPLPPIAYPDTGDWFGFEFTDGTKFIVIGWIRKARKYPVLGILYGRPPVTVNTPPEFFLPNFSCLSREMFLAAVDNGHWNPLLKGMAGSRRPEARRLRTLLLQRRHWHGQHADTSRHVAIVCRNPQLPYWFVK